MTFGVKVFSKRERERLGQVPDHYVYDQIPDEVRNKLVFLSNELARSLADHIWNAHESDSRSHSQLTEEFAREVCYEICKTHGWVSLPGAKNRAAADLSTFVTEGSVPYVLDAVEVVLHVHRGPFDA